MKLITFIIVLTLLSSCRRQESYEITETHHFQELNEDLIEGKPTVDVEVFLARAVPLKWPHMMNRLKAAKEIFAQAGVQIKIISAQTIDIPKEDLSINASKRKLSKDPNLKFSNLYRSIEKQESKLTPHAIEVFSKATSSGINQQRSVKILVLSSVRFQIESWDIENQKWFLENVGTGGLSFPHYVYGNQIPYNLQGIITLSSSNPNPSETSNVIAHEMGHKLINVTHEGQGVCPEDGPRGDNDIMLYGPQTNTRIPKGEKGRWQQERLLLSPYLYNLNNDGIKVFENNFTNSGFYFDELYSKNLPEGPYYIRGGCNVLTTPTDSDLVHKIPGIIEAEDFAPGKQNEAYFDLDPFNQGKKYRPGFVDIQNIIDTNGKNFTVGWIRSTEWLEYNIEILEDGLYSLRSNIASPVGIGSMIVSIDSEILAQTTITNTGGWRSFEDLSFGVVNLKKGKARLRILFKSQHKGDFVNLNWLKFIKN